MALAYTNCCYAMQLKRILEEAQVELKAQLHLGSVSMIRSYVKEKFGVALLPLAVIEEDVPLCPENTDGNRETPQGCPTMS